MAMANTGSAVQGVYTAMDPVRDFLHTVLLQVASVADTDHGDRAEVSVHVFVWV